MSLIVISEQGSISSNISEIHTASSTTPTSSTSLFTPTTEFTVASNTPKLDNYPTDVAVQDQQKTILIETHSACAKHSFQASTNKKTRETSKDFQNAKPTAQFAPTTTALFAGVTTSATNSYIRLTTDTNEQTISVGPASNIFSLNHTSTSRSRKMTPNNADSSFEYLVIAGISTAIGLSVEGLLIATVCVHVDSVVRRTRRTTPVVDDQVGFPLLYLSG